MSPEDKLKIDVIGLTISEGIKALPREALELLAWSAIHKVISSSAPRAFLFLEKDAQKVALYEHGAKIFECMLEKTKEDLVRLAGRSKSEVPPSLG